MAQLLSMGELLIDFTPVGETEDGRLLFARNPGGAPANVTVQAKRAGVSAGFLGRVGKDMFGDFLVKTLQDCGVDTAGLSQDPDYATTLTARSRCRLLLFPQPLIEEWMERWPQVGRSYVTYLSQRIWFLSGKIDALTAGTAGRKVAQYLLAHEEEGRVALDCSLTGLAGRLGVSRASLYRALDDLQAQGAISHRGRTIRILDQKILEDL